MFVLIAQRVRVAQFPLARSFDFISFMMGPLFGNSGGHFVVIIAAMPPGMFKLDGFLWKGIK